MSVRPEIARRDLLKVAGCLGAGYLLVACPLSAPARAAEPPGPWPRTIPDDRVDSWLAVKADGSVTCFTGRVDLGTGARTALAQIVADESDVDFERVAMVTGDTARTPDQGTTSASNTIQREAIPIRHAAADARQMLLKLASDRLGVAVSDLRAAWVADVDVDLANGEVRVTRVVVAQDASLMVNPNGVELQVHGNVIQSVSRALMEEVKFDSAGVTRE